METQIWCLCRRAAQTVTLDNASGDQSTVTLCHCSACRWTSGMLCTSYLALNSKPTSLDGLVEYSESENNSRWFCGTCGAHVFLHVKDSDKFFVARGVLETRDLVTKTIRQLCTRSTADRGMSAFPLKTAEDESVCFTGTRHVDRDPIDGASVSSGLQGQLSAGCHCGGIRYYITPPDETSKNAWSWWPDLIVPFHLGSPDNPDDIKWWLRAGETKYLAGLCTCNSCRLAAGFPVQSWAFVPKSNIFKSDGSPLSYDLHTMQRYESSPAVYREFCNVCGATVFWHCDARPRVIDVSVGLLRADSGARAEEYLDWEVGRISFAEEAPDQSLIQSLAQGMAAWGKARHGAA